jgi:sec-independent protein translocase protein TatB
VFFDIGSVEFLVLIVIAILLFGPDKLPKLIQDAMRFVRKVRDYSDSAKRDIRAELGPEFKDFEFDDLNPKKFARKHLLDGDELGLRELRDSLDVRKELTEVSDAVNGNFRSLPSGPDIDDATDASDFPDLSDLPDVADGADAPVDLSKDRPAKARLDKDRPAKARLDKNGDAPAGKAGRAAAPAATPAAEAAAVDMDAT